MHKYGLAQGLEHGKLDDDELLDFDLSRYSS
jgi:hypothetical protein